MLGYQRYEELLRMIGAEEAASSTREIFIGEEHWFGELARDDADSALVMAQIAGFMLMLVTIRKNSSDGK